MAAAAVISVLILAVIWRQSSRPGVGRGSPPGWALARILLVLIVLLLIAFANASVAGDLVSGFFGGIKTAVSSFADFLGHWFHQASAFLRLSTINPASAVSQPRANPGAQLAAIGAGIVGAFLLIGVVSDHAGVVIGTGFLNGGRQDAYGFARFFNMLQLLVQSGAGSAGG